MRAKLFRHRPSPATIIACLALFAALGSTAVAASRYVVTSTHQIKPSVLSAIATPGPDLDIHGPEASVEPGKHLVAVRADCPSGYHVVTGGYFAELGPGAFVLLNGPRGTSGWNVWIDTEHSAVVSKATPEALCAPGHVAVFVKKGSH
jgi:hypothetical protein